MFSQKIATVKDLLIKLNVDAIVIHRPLDFYWITNVELFFGFIIITKNNIGCMFDGRDVLQINECLKSTPIKCIKINPAKTVQELTKYFKQHKIKSIALSMDTSVSELSAYFDKWQVNKFFNSYEMRSIKTKEEIKLLQKSADIACAGILMLKKFIKPGVSELEAEKKLLSFFIDKGASTVSFRPIILFGEHSAYIHGTPSNRRYKAGENVLADIGCVYKGYCSDITRCWGAKNKELIKIRKLVTNAQQQAIKMVKPGVKAKDIDVFARQAINKYKNQTYEHGTGHGVGLYIHERPVINAVSQDIIKENNVFSVEPGIYIEGFGGVRIEDTVVATESGCVVLTKKAPKY